MTPVLRAGTGPARTLRAAPAVDRALAFACVGALAAINAEAAPLLAMIRSAGLFLAFSWLGGVSAVVWFALFALLQIGLEGSSARLHRRDVPILLIAIGCAFLPVPFAAQAGLLLAGIYLQLSSAPASRDRRIAMILLALTGPLLWGKLLLNLFATPVLDFDARLVGLVMRSPVEGNMLQFAHSSQHFVIAAPCSSIHNISLAVLLWAVALAAFALRPDRRLVAFGIAAVLLMFVLNLARLTMIGLFPDAFVFLHDGLGSILFGWAALLGAGLVVGLGANDAFRRQR